MPRKRPSPSAYTQVAREHLATLDRVAERGSAARLKGLYQDALADMERNARHLFRRSDLKNSFTAHQSRMVIAQLRDGARRLSQHMAGAVTAHAREAQADGASSIVRSIRRLETVYSGEAPVLGVHEAARFIGAVPTPQRSLLRNASQHGALPGRVQRSMATYGTRLVRGFEQDLAKTMITNGTLDDAIGRIQERGDLEWWAAERIARTECLTGETLVDGAVVRAVHRRWFEGDVFEVVTERGRKFTATANHPMLTRRGWVAAGLLQQSDHLICDGRQQRASAPRDEHIVRGPTTLAEIFDAVSAVGVRERRRTAQPDFHGDGADGYVDVARPYGCLEIGRFTPLYKPLVEELFAPSDLARASFCPACMKLLSVEKQRCFCNVAHVHSGVAQSLLDDLVVYAERICDRLCSFATVVPFNDLFERQVLNELRVHAATGVEGVPCFRQGSRNSGVSDRALYGNSMDSELLGHSRRAQPRDVEFDRVVSLKRRLFHGFVYNLSTPDGYFAINGAYTGNTAWAYNASQADMIDASTEELPDLMMRWSEHVDDLTGAPYDDRVAPDSIVMHGQVAAPGETFVMPEDARVDSVRWGLRYAFPPNRPNDRATILPVRPAWGIPCWQWIGNSRVPWPR